MKIKTLLEEEIRKEIELLGKTNVNTEEYKILVDGITKMTDRVIDFEKTDNEKYDKEDIRHIEYKTKHAELEMERKDRRTKNWISIGSIATGFIVTCVGTWATFKFEETGTVTSLLGRGFINRLIPKK